MIRSSKTVTPQPWGSQCLAWPFVEELELSIKEEQMPAGASDERHYHERAQQFFYMLDGTGTFELENQPPAEVKAREGIYIQAGVRHRIVNNTGADIRFLVVSQPSAAGDRINVKP